MNEYQLQFQPEDITRKFKELHSPVEDSLNDFLTLEAHSLQSPLQGVLGALSFLSPEPGIKKEWRDRLEEEALKNTMQRAYAHNLLQLSVHLAESARSIIHKSYWKNFPRKTVDKLASDYYETLESIASYIPLTEALLGVAELTPDQEKRALHLDTCFRILFYAANRVFSPEFQRGEYYLPEDINSFFISASPSLAQEGIQLIYGKIQPIRTRQDYLTYAVLPLVWNAREHAFNLENDVTSRMEDKNFWKHIGVFGSPEKRVPHNSIKGASSPAEQGLYIVTIKDNGFGIRPELLEHLFEKGATTKEHDGTQHGIGLWGVKEFVERNGGTISVETELGKGTRFEFTIPYSHLESFVCVQAQPSE